MYFFDCLIFGRSICLDFSILEYNPTSISLLYYLITPTEGFAFCSLSIRQYTIYFQMIIVKYQFGHSLSSLVQSGLKFGEILSVLYISPLAAMFFLS